MHTMRWPAVAALSAAIVVSPPMSCPARAQNYPSRPITIIVSLAAGTGMDTLARVYGEKLSQSLGQPVILENKPGGAGVAAGEAIIKSPPDGYTLAIATSAVMAIRPTLFKLRPFTPATDFVPIFVDRLSGAMKEIMASPDMQGKILHIGLIPHDSPSVEGVQRYIAAEAEKWGTLVRQLGLAGSQ